MADEEMAEEIANKRCHEIMCFGHCNFSNPKHHRCGEWHREYNCALEGIKAGRPQWHDLRKDPEDLPIGEVFYWFDENPNLKDGKVYGRSIGYYNPYEKEWHGYYKGCPCRVHNVIAWCEIPTFDKE